MQENGHFAWTSCKISKKYRKVRPRLWDLACMILARIVDELARWFDLGNKRHKTAKQVDLTKQVITQMDHEWRVQSSSTEACYSVRQICNNCDCNSVAVFVTSVFIHIHALVWII